MAFRLQPLPPDVGTFAALKLGALLSFVVTADAPGEGVRGGAGFWRLPRDWRYALPPMQTLALAAAAAVACALGYVIVGLARRRRASPARTLFAAALGFYGAFALIWLIWACCFAETTFVP
jgi:hypothetical protein